MFADATGTPLDLLYDVSHNLAKIETHPIDGQLRSVCVHRKGATRSLPPHHHELPAELAAVGQPVLIPGTMGTASYVLAGVTGNPAFFSTAHGAGRVLSRHQAARHTSGEAIRASLAKRGIIVRGTSRRVSPRKSRRPTKTSTRSSKPAIRVASRAKWLALFPWAVSKDESTANIPAVATAFFSGADP